MQPRIVPEAGAPTSKDPAAQPPKLPLATTVASAYAAVFLGLGTVFRISWIWLALLLLGTVIMRVIVAHTDKELNLRNLGAVLGFLFFVSFVSIGAAWHRELLSGPRSDRPLHLWKYFGNWFLAYLAFTFGIMLASFALDLVSGYVLGWKGTSVVDTIGKVLDAPSSLLAIHSIHSIQAAVLHAAALAVLLLGLIIFVRVTVVLPAKALGSALGFSDAWSKTSGNSFRLVAGWALTLAAPLSLLGWTLHQLPPGGMPGGEVAKAVGLALLLIPFMLSGMVYLAFLTFAYRHFFDGYADAGEGPLESAPAAAGANSKQA